jgi:flagellar biogenesis protein FliO
LDAIEQAAIIGVVLGVLATALWILQRRGLVRLQGFGVGSRQVRELQLVERLQLTPQHSLCLVRMNNKTLLIGTAPTSCTLLSKGEED